MKAAVISEPDATPAFADHQDPPPDPRHGVLTMVAAGLHPVVRALATGRHYGTAGSWPIVTGVDAVARTADGTLAYVAGTRHPYGTFAEFISPSVVIPLPHHADPIMIAAGMHPSMSSWLPLKERRNELGGPGLGTVLILGASGMTGRLAVQNAQVLGARHVIAVGRDATALGALSGPDRSLVTLTGVAELDRDSLVEAVAGHHPSTVLDYVWGAPAEAAFAALARLRLTPADRPIAYLQVGESAGPHAALPAGLLRGTAISIRGSGARTYPMGEIMLGISEVMAHFADGAVALPVMTYPLAKVATAWQAIRGPGRIVLTFESVRRPR
jgi:NADPH:quinone reductase-like Zn-dependent oxidoreductase